jgi:DNA invertase Pin-like site-specific DNA recombinase
MKTIGYIRVSTDKQDADSQRHLLLEYANQHKLIIDEFIEIEISSRKNQKERRIDELLARLTKGDTLIVAELSRLGRNMLETMNIIHALTENGVAIIFVRQPELSTIGPQTKLLLAIYSYFAESERDFIALRTKQGLAAARASGQQLGRPKGAKSKQRILDPYKEQIMRYLKLGLDLAAILKLINPQLGKPTSYQMLKYYVAHESELVPLWRRPRQPNIL